MDSGQGFGRSDAPLSMGDSAALRELGETVALVREDRKPQGLPDIAGLLAEISQLQALAQTMRLNVIDSRISTDVAQALTDLKPELDTLGGLSEADYHQRLIEPAPV